MEVTESLRPTLQYARGNDSPKALTKSRDTKISDSTKDELDLEQSLGLLNGTDNISNGLHGLTKAELATSDKKGAKDTPEWVILLKTLCIYCSFVGLGFSSGTLGPTLVHVEIMYMTNTQGMAVAMVGVCVGYLLGSVLTGLVFDRFNRTLQCALGTLGLGVPLIMAPRTDSLYFFHACITLMAFCQGFVYSAGSPFIMELWEGSKLRAPVMQGIHAIWAVGSFSCPFIAVPFLADIPQWYYQQSHSREPSSNLTTDADPVIHLNVTASTQMNSYSNITERYPDIYGLEDVRYVYMFAGGVSVFTSCLYFITFFITGPSLLRKVISKTTTSKEVTVTKEYTNEFACDRKFKAIFVFCAFMYCNIYYWYDYVPGNLLSAFVIKGLHWKAKYGALITSMFWGSFGVGRMLGVPASYFVSPSIMLLFNVLGATTGFVLLGTGAYMSDVLVWLSVALMGVSTATTLPTLMLWTSKFFPIDGKLGAMFLVASSTGGLSGAVLIGYLFESSHMWLVYLDLAACVVNFVLFVFMVCMVKYFKSLNGNPNSGIIEVKANGEKQKM